MPNSPRFLLVVGILLAVIAGVIATLITGLAMSIAWVLTLLLDGMKMPQAMTPAAIVAVATLYFSYAFLNQRMPIPLGGECECDECRKKNG